jgi:hypothetical protein
MADLHKLLGIPGDPEASFKGDIRSDLLVGITDVEQQKALVIRYKEKLSQQIEDTRHASRVILRVTSK